METIPANRPGSPPRSGAFIPSERGAFILFALVLVVVVLGALAIVRSQSQAMWWVDHTHRVVEQIDTTLSALKDAETAQRGYLLTGDPDYLRPYHAALTVLPSTLNAMARLTSDDLRQQRALTEIRNSVDAKMADLAESLTLHDGGDAGAALALVRTNRGRALMDRLRDQLSRMRAEEERLLTARAARASQQTIWTVTAVVASGAVALLLLAFLRGLMRRSAARIRSSEERLATTVASVGDAVIGTDALGGIERMNLVAEQLTGWTFNESLGKPLDQVFQIINGHTRATVESPYEKVLREGRVVGLDDHTLLIDKGGTERPIEASGAPIRDKDGAIEGAVLIFRDASERYASQKALADSEARFRALAENIPLLCWMADETGSIFWYNSRWYEYTGTTPEEMSGWGWQSVHDPAILPGVLERWQRSIASGTPFDMIFPLKGADGLFRPFLTRVAPLRDETGRVTRWFGSNTDVAEQHAAEQALREADQRKDEFLATLAHELRNPLAPIRNAVRLLRPEVPASTQALARQIIERQSAQMARLLEDLLDVSRITRGVIELRLEVLDLRRIVDDVILANRSLLERLHHSIHVHLSGDPLWVDGDGPRLYQILDNLVQNAAKYTEPGGRVDISAIACEDRIELKVADTGIGIAPDSLQRVFDLFAQVHIAGRGRSGLGIGLSVVKQLVTLHGGTVQAESGGLGCGSCFRVSLPRAKQSPSAEQGEPPAVVATLYKTQPRILLVDDHPDIVESLALVLRGHGYSVHTAEDGSAALPIAEALRPDVMLIDLGMPKMDGLQVGRWVRQQPWGRTIQLIAVTGWGQAGDRQRTEEVGFDFHLVKPVDPDTLISLIEQISGNSGNAQESA